MVPDAVAVGIRSIGLARTLRSVEYMRLKGAVGHLDTLGGRGDQGPFAPSAFLILIRSLWGAIIRS